MEKRRQNRRFLISMPFILDAHQDLAYNMTVLGRDYSLPNAQIRQHDSQTGSDAYGGASLLGLPENNAANVGLVFGTLFSVPERRRNPNFEGEEYYKVFASWSGDYLNGPSWKLSSAIKEIKEDELYPGYIICYNL